MTRIITAVSFLFLFSIQTSLAGPYAQGILAGGDENDKGLKANKARSGGSTAEDMMLLVKGEEFDLVMSLAMGLYLEKGEFERGRTAYAVKAMAARKGLFGKATVLAAFSPHMEEIVKELIAKRTKSDRQVAAAILAIYADSHAWFPVKGKKIKAKGKKAKPAVPVVDIDPFLSELVKDKDKIVLELTLVAAAYARSKAIEDAARKMKPMRAPDLAAARLWYLACMGEKDLADKEIADILKPKVRPDDKWTTMSTRLSNYDIRGNRFIYLCKAFGEVKTEKNLDQLHKFIDHWDVRVQIEAARAIERVGSQRSLTTLWNKLNNKPVWPVKVAALSAVGAIPANPSIEKLIVMRGEEPGRFRQDVVYALASIARTQAAGNSAHEWDQWWQKNKTTFKSDPAATKAFREKYKVQNMAVTPLAAFYGSKIISDRVVFVLDTSASMRGDKIANLKVNMTDTLQTLPNNVKFNVVDFGGIINVMFNAYAGSLIGAKQSARAADIVNEMELSGGTRSYDAMEVGIKLIGVDTIVYLSDGAPVGGQYEHWERIIRAFHLFNRYRPIAIDTVYFAKGGGGGGGRGGNFTYMKQIADLNYGLANTGDPNKKGKKDEEKDD